MEHAPEPTDAKPPGNASWRKHWDSVSAVCVAAGCVAVLAVTGESRLAGFVGIMLVVPVVLIAFPRFLAGRVSPASPGYRAVEVEEAAVSRPLPGGTMRRVAGQVRPENYLRRSRIASTRRTFVDGVGR